MRLPIAQNYNIIQQESGNELLIYKLDSNQAYCLNPTSTIIYRHCDGKTEFEEIRRKFRMNKETILLALQQFEREDLLAEKTDFRQLSRRELLLKTRNAAIALPILTAIVAPTAIHAASCVNPGGAAPNAIVQVCVGPVANCNLACQSPAVSSLCCSGMSGLGLCGASCNCVCL